MKPTWLTAFVDLPPTVYDAGVAFWQGVTGYSVSPSRGERGEFATLVPPEGDAFLRVQRVDDEPGGVHLDVHRPGQPFEVRRSRRVHLLRGLRPAVPAATARDLARGSPVGDRPDHPRHPSRGVRR